MSFLTASDKRLGSPPTPRKAWSRRSPHGLVIASMRSSSLPQRPRLPTHERPKSVGSSARQSMTSTGLRKGRPFSFKVLATSSAAMTPATPSKRPPRATVSLCDPRAITGADGSRPSSLPTRFPAASILVERPASSSRLMRNARPCMKRGEKALLVNGRSGSVISPSFIKSSQRRSASMGDE